MRVHLVKNITKIPTLNLKIILNIHKKNMLNL